MIRVRAKTLQTPHGPRSWQPKTKRNRAVPISQALRDFLDRHTARPSDAALLFPSEAGTLRDPDDFSRELRLANKDAALPWSCLDYRHTFGSQLAQRGISLFKIATLLGNSPEICRRHYASITPEVMAGEVDFRLPRQAQTVFTSKLATST
jgi:integrase